MNDVAITIAAVASSVAAVATGVDSAMTRWGQRRAMRATRELHKTASATLQAVATVNGLSVGELLDAQEGRRIIDTVPAAEQTAAERHYVEGLPPREQP